MRGRRLEKTGGVFAGIRRGFFRAENDADARRSFAAVEWHYSDRLLVPLNGGELRRTRVLRYHPDRGVMYCHE